MKKTLLGGFIFVGGAIMFSIGTLGVAHVDIRAHIMQFPRYLGVLAMIVGIVLGVHELTKGKTYRRKSERLPFGSFEA